MKDNLHRIFSVAMALLLLASTTSWTVGKHYCMGSLIDVSFFEHAEDCGMDMTSDENSGMAALQDEDSCCKEEIITVIGQDDLRVSINDLSLGHQLFFVAFTGSFLNVFQTTSERHVPNEHYPPPILVKDIQLLDEVYLI